MAQRRNRMFLNKGEEAKLPQRAEGPSQRERQGSGPELPGLLLDPRLDHRANLGQRAELVRTKQQTIGNLALRRLIQAKMTVGRPLSESVRAYFEPRFGRDFSQVRLHTDSAAAAAAQELEAQAFTTGQDIVFGAAQYAPETTAGKELLAHELTHVVQQAGTVPVQQGAGGKGHRDSSVPTLQRRKRRRRRRRTGRVRIRRSPTGYFDYYGTTLAQIEKAMGARAGWGRCDWQITYSHYAVDGITKWVNVTLQLSYRIPRWRGRGWKKASRAVKREWRRMIRSLWVHERGHATLARRTAYAIQKALVGKHEDDLQGIYDERMDKLGQRQREYDVKTQHGERQGVHLDTSIK